MSRRILIVLMLAGLAVVTAVAALEDTPGYMDAEYYFAGGLNLAQGRGFWESYLWNYLDDPAGLPHPSHAYWMPLASLLAAVGMKLAGSAGFAAGRWPFIFLAALVPPLTAGFAYSLGKGRPPAERRAAGLLAGGLALAPGFYLPYLPTTDTFGIYMLLGLGLLWILQSIFNRREAEGGPGIRALLLGALAGGLHLARADGFLWLGTAGLALVAASTVRGRGRRIETSQLGPALTGLMLGYALVMGPWLARNLAVFGSPLAPGGSRALWLTDYDALFSYPAGRLNAAAWWASGWEAILGARAWALGQNLQTALAVQGQIVLAPLALLGGWSLRERAAVRAGALGWALTLIAMTIFFPFAGARGGFFHSGAALQPLIWALAAYGLGAFVRWGARARNWNPHTAGRVFSTALAVLAAAVTVFVAANRVIGPQPEDPGWDRASRRYLALEAALVSSGAPPEAPVFVVNPPGYHLVSGRPALAVPDGGVEALAGAARRYGARYLLLEPDHPRSLAGLYAEPAGQPGLRLVETIAGTHLFILEGGTADAPVGAH